MDLKPVYRFIAGFQLHGQYFFAYYGDSEGRITARTHYFYLVHSPPKPRLSHAYIEILLGLICTSICRSHPEKLDDLRHLSFWLLRRELADLVQIRVPHAHAQHDDLIVADGQVFPKDELILGWSLLRDSLQPAGSGAEGYALQEIPDERLGHDPWDLRTQFNIPDIHPRPWNGYTVSSRFGLDVMNSVIITLGQRLVNGKNESNRRVEEFTVKATLSVYMQPTWLGKCTD